MLSWRQRCCSISSRTTLLRSMYGLLVWLCTVCCSVSGLQATIESTVSGLKSLITRMSKSKTCPSSRLRSETLFTIHFPSTLKCPSTRSTTKNLLARRSNKLMKTIFPSGLTQMIWAWTIASTLRTLWSASRTSVTAQCSQMVTQRSLCSGHLVTLTNARSR